MAKYIGGEVGVLGAGIMGACLALELAQRGFQVDLIDLASNPIMGASYHNEGKLHLGFVYAKDPKQETYKLMQHGSISFSSIIERLTGASAESLEPSRKFQYFIPSDSQLSIDQIQDHFERVQDNITKLMLQNDQRYLGLSSKNYFERNSETTHSELFSSDSVIGSFSTEERSISTTALANILTEAVKQNPNIRFLGETGVISVEPLPGGDVEVEVNQSGKYHKRKYRSVANCLWEDKVRIDRTAGIDDPGPWVYRYKATIRINSSTVKSIPSATGILGAYGDIVNHDDGSYYISWYPRCKLGQNLEGDGRVLHDQIHKGYLVNKLHNIGVKYPRLGTGISSITHKRFVTNCIRDLAQYVPSLSELLRYRGTAKLGGGVILARGATDINDPDSLLHQRSVIGPVAHGSYLTIDTGKYCTAPMFAVKAADMIKEII